MPYVVHGLNLLFKIWTLLIKNLYFFLYMKMKFLWNFIIFEVFELKSFSLEFSSWMDSLSISWKMGEFTTPGPRDTDFHGLVSFFP